MKWNGNPAARFRLLAEHGHPIEGLPSYDGLCVTRAVRHTCDQWDWELLSMGRVITGPLNRRQPNNRPVIGWVDLGRYLEK